MKPIPPRRRNKIRIDADNDRRQACLREWYFKNLTDNHQQLSTLQRALTAASEADNAAEWSANARRRLLALLQIGDDSRADPRPRPADWYANALFALAANQLRLTMASLLNADGVLTDPTKPLQELPDDGT